MIAATLTHASASRHAVSARARTAGPWSPAAGIRAEELHSGELGVQDTKAIGHHLVGQVPLEVDQKTVIAQPPLGRPRLELRQVDAAGREFAQDPVQAPGAVLALEADDARLVVSGRCGQPARARATNRVWLSEWSSTLEAITSRP